MINGNFFWYDMVSKDFEATRVFMTRLFDWEDSITTMPDGTPYASFFTSGNLACGLMPLTEPRNFEFGRAHWMAYLRVDRLMVAQTSVKLHGGQVIDEPRRVPEVGTYQVIRDPAGALLSLVEARQNLIGEEFSWNSIMWNELSCQNDEKIIEFYQEVSGWHHMPNVEGDFEYGFFVQNDVKMAGLLSLDGQSYNTMHPGWNTYIAVEDVDTMSAKVKDFGGHLVADPFDMPAVGRIALVIEPGECQFSLLQPPT